MDQRFYYREIAEKLFLSKGDASCSGSKVAVDTNDVASRATKRHRCFGNRRELIELGSNSWSGLIRVNVR